jgi:hypothetical protein
MFIKHLSLNITLICGYMWDLTNLFHIQCMSDFVLKTGYDEPRRWSAQPSQWRSRHLFACVLEHGGGISTLLSNSCALALAHKTSCSSVLAFGCPSSSLSQRRRQPCWYGRGLGRLQVVGASACMAATHLPLSSFLCATCIGSRRKRRCIKGPMGIAGDPAVAWDP